MISCRNTRVAIFLATAILIFEPAQTISAQLRVSISFDQSFPQLAFAAGKIRDVFQTGTFEVGFAGPGNPVPEENGISIILGSDIEQELGEEGFTIKKGGDTWLILGGGAAGAMYGGLEFAEQVRLYGLEGVKEISREPYMQMRGSKFNIPLDVRTPSYTDVCDAAQKNIAEMWSMDFWKEYLDRMATYRFNFVSLWNLHPFPSMVRVPDYPDIALENVMKSNGPFKENYRLEGIGFDDPSIMDDISVVKEMTMEEKIEFWREVMAYGKSRNIDFYVVTWNIFVYGTQGKYGITDNIENEVTVDYFRKSVEQMFITYPDLAGIGLTTGENFGEAGFEQKEEWAFNTYARGTLDASEKEPDRKITFLHRQHMTGAKDIARKFKPLSDQENIDFLFSFKYAKAHVFSSVNQPFCNDFVNEIEGMKTIWTLRNDDNYYFRWGGAGFVREFIANIPYEVSRGFYYGSDQYIWGREFLSREPATPREIEVAKHWYHWMLWGRLGYDPSIPDQRFVDLLGQHFGLKDGSPLFTAWQEASMIYPKTTGFHWGSLDFQWYIEGCKSRPGPANTETGFHDVNRFITLAPHPGTGYQSIPGYVSMRLEEGSTDLVSPLELAAQIHAHSDMALEILEELDPGDHKELRITLDDIRCMACLGKYYAHKITGATCLHMCRELPARKIINQQSAVAELTRAAGYWEMYTQLARSNYYNPLWTNRVGYVDWEEIQGWVLEDIEQAKNAL
jgi:hypothetical protein